MTLYSDGHAVIHSSEEGTRTFRVTELRRAGTLPISWEKGSVIFTGTADDRSRVRILFRQTRPNILEPFMYERQSTMGDVTLLPRPAAIIRCDPPQ
jgi:hypothetical protein